MSYTGGLGPIGDMGVILRAVGIETRPTVGLCCNCRGVRVLWGPWESRNGSVTGQALHAGGDET